MDETMTPGDDGSLKNAQRETEKWNRFMSRRTVKNNRSKSKKLGDTIERKTLDDQFTKVFTKFADESISRKLPSTEVAEILDPRRRAFSDGDTEDPVEAISRIAAQNDHFRKTVVRKATILKKGVSFNQEYRRKQRRRKVEEFNSSSERPVSSSDIQGVKITEEEDPEFQNSSF